MTPATLDTEHKEFSTLRARAALLGAVLHRLDGGGYLIAWSRGGLTRELATLDEARELLARMGVPT